MLDTERAGRPFECGTRRGREARPRRARQADQPAGSRRPACRSRSRPPSSRRSEGQRHCAAGRPHLRVRGPDRPRRETPDELAGVIAHEIGHVAHRDGTRSVLQAAGLSFLFGMLLGDFIGGGVVVIAAQTVVQSAYSREVEGCRRSLRSGPDGARSAATRARSATILERIAGAIEPGIEDPARSSADQGPRRRHQRGGRRGVQAARRAAARRRPNGRRCRRICG